MTRTRRAAAFCSAIVLLAAGCSRRSESGTLSIAAAADLRFALDDLARAFHSTHPAIELKIAYGSSGNFYSQIRNGGPFDIFLSADVDYARKLAAERFAASDSVFVYAVGRLVVWVPAQSPFDPATALRDPRAHHIAIANPEHAPYGRAAEAALRALGVYDEVAPNLVLGENIAQTLQFVESGAADCGVVALSLALAPPVREHGRYWEIPFDRYPRMDQGGVIVKDSPAARAFRAWLLAPAARAILRSYGFSLPER